MIYSISKICTNCINLFAWVFRLSVSQWHCGNWNIKHLYPNTKTIGHNLLSNASVIIYHFNGKLYGLKMVLDNQLVYYLMHAFSLLVQFIGLRVAWLNAGWSMAILLNTK